MEQIRAFIAIELPDRLKVELDKLEVQFKKEGQTWIKWVDPNSIHLTLKFLGNISTSSIGQITVEMEEATRGIHPFLLEVQDLGVFPNLKRIQVVWVGLSGEIDKVILLQKRLESNLERLGFVSEKRKFTPHLTIARLRDQATPDKRQRFGQTISGTKFKAGFFNVDGISLMRSQLTRQGAIYSRLSSVRLTNPPEVNIQ